MATGVLVVGVEGATRLLGHLSLTDKDYLATIRLGASTVTDDAEGEFTAFRGAAGVTAECIEEQLAELRGEIWQTPSSVSAIKVAGVRSYARVRAGEDVALKPRPVTVSRLEVLAIREHTTDRGAVIDLDVDVTCSTGTYVRALARDLGLGLGVGGHLAALRRTRVGPFDLSRAVALDDSTTELQLLGLTEVARLCFPTQVLDDVQAERVRHGRTLPGVRLPAAPTALLDRSGRFLALYRPCEDGGVAVSVFAG